jgi:hypothetical protein
VLGIVVLLVGGGIWYVVGQEKNGNIENQNSSVDSGWKTINIGDRFSRHSFDYPSYLSERENYPGDLLAKEKKLGIESIMTGLLSDNFLAENGGSQFYLSDAISLEFGGPFRDIYTKEVQYGDNKVLERRIEHADSLDGPMEKITLLFLIPTSDPGMMIYVKISGKNTPEFEADVSKVIESVQ